MVCLCATQAQVQPKYVTALNYMECVLEFKEGIQMMDIKSSLEQIENWLGMQV